MPGEMHTSPLPSTREYHVHWAGLISLLQWCHSCYTTNNQARQRGLLLPLTARPVDVYAPRAKNFFGSTAGDLTSFFWRSFRETTVRICFNPVKLRPNSCPVQEAGVTTFPKPTTRIAERSTRLRMGRVARNMTSIPYHLGG